MSAFSRSLWLIDSIDAYSGEKNTSYRERYVAQCFLPSTVLLIRVFGFLFENYKETLQMAKFVKALPNISSKSLRHLCLI